MPLLNAPSVVPDLALQALFNRGQFGNVEGEACQFGVGVAEVCLEARFTGLG